jgi:hypothetical protein
MILKMSFVNCVPIKSGERCDSSTMSTNFAELPDDFEPSPQMILSNLVTALRCFVSHVRAAVERGGWDSDVYACDWVSMTITKSRK